MPTATSEQEPPKSRQAARRHDSVRGPRKASFAATQRKTKMERKVGAVHPTSLPTIRPPLATNCRVPVRQEIRIADEPSAAPGRGNWDQKGPVNVGASWRERACNVALAKPPAPRDNGKWFPSRRCPRPLAILSQRNRLLTPLFDP
jgi:hypothetical protein